MIAICIFRPLRVKVHLIQICIFRPLREKVRLDDFVEISTFTLECGIGRFQTNVKQFNNKSIDVTLTCDVQWVQSCASFSSNL